MMKVKLNAYVPTSDELLKRILDIFERGRHQIMQIQDVEEWVDGNSVLLDEATMLRREYGNFWIEKNNL